LSFLDQVNLLAELLQPLPTLREVPRGARVPLAELTAQLCEAAAAAAPLSSPEAERAWVLLVLHHRLLLRAPTTTEAGGRARRREQLDLVLGRIARAGQGGWEALLEEAREQAAAAAAHRATAAARGGLSGAALAGEVIRRVSLGELGRAAQLLAQAKVAAPTPEVLAELRSLLVVMGQERGALAADPDAAEEVPARTLAKELRKAPRSSGPGPSGSRFAHWQTCQHSPGAMAALGKVVDRIASGQVPPGAAAGLALTTLTPLRKKNGRLRPVAAGEALRRLTAKALARAHAKPIADAVGAAQFGVGTPGGTEALCHAAQVESGQKPRAVFVALDMRNAFPSLDRDQVLAAVRRHAPPLLPYARLVLGRRSFYRFLGANGEGEAPPADQGVDQGGPLAPAFLAVTIREPLERLEAQLRELAEAEGYLPEAAADAVRVRAYLDDVLVRVPDTLAARVPEVAQAALAEVGGRPRHREDEGVASQGRVPARV